ncbi:hypothetical protein ABVK25_005590 [Lepraria finkii]|uniref:Secreted protein n=1 Tax=Lepraria finkii TaxID=1340010 RepID=A0ABR4BAH7_9LECA
MRKRDLLVQTAVLALWPGGTPLSWIEGEKCFTSKVYTGPDSMHQGQTTYSEPLAAQKHRQMHTSASQGDG